ncbi:MAG: 4-hydroxythreonine-4-phosphate dehydrogenase PdxA [Gemmatimonadota bacterium]
MRSDPGPNTLVRLAVTLGDPRGIGPEVVRAAVRAFASEDPETHCILLGDHASLDSLPSGLESESMGRFDGSLESAGRITSDAIRRGVELAVNGKVQGLVTGPVHKPALHAAGLKFPGQTELLQALTDAPRVGMLMASESSRVDAPLRILLATTHLALREVPTRITGSLIQSQVGLLWQSLRDRWGIESPRIALCALNPHASDGGLFGDEEARVLTPAVESLRSGGIDVFGPLPADTVFLKLIDRAADAVVVPYHDVGMAVFKTLSFGRGVNVTLGLPFIRTSPDHGTAFDIAGTGRADPTSTLEAIRLAARLSRRPEPASD